jgi:hypothetical protein
MKPLINFIQKQRQAYKFIPGLHIHPRPFSEWTLGKFLRSVPRSLILAKKNGKAKTETKVSRSTEQSFRRRRVKLRGVNTDAERDGTPRALGAGFLDGWETPVTTEVDGRFVPAMPASVDGSRSASNGVKPLPPSCAANAHARNLALAPAHTPWMPLLKWYNNSERPQSVD